MYCKLSPLLMGTIKQITHANNRNMLIDTIFQFPDCSYKKNPQKTQQNTTNRNMLIDIIFKFPDCSYEKHTHTQHPPPPKKILVCWTSIG